MRTRHWTAKIIPNVNRRPWVWGIAFVPRRPWGLRPLWRYPEVARMGRLGFEPRATVRTR